MNASTGNTDFPDLGFGSYIIRLRSVFSRLPTILLPIDSQFGNQEFVRSTESLRIYLKTLRVLRP